MFFFLLLFHAKEEFISIDIGAFTTKSSIVDSFVVPKIAKNSLSKKGTSSFVTLQHSTSIDNLFNKKEEDKPSIGLRYLTEAEKNFTDHSGFFSLFNNLDNETTNKITERFGINPTLNGLSFTETLSIFISLYVPSITSSFDDKKCLVIVPSTYTRYQCNKMMNAIKKTHYNPIGFVTDDSAAYAEYIDKWRENPTTADRNVLFVDIGAMSINVYLGNIKHNEPESEYYVNKKDYKITNSEGGAYVTQRLAEKIMKSDENIEERLKLQLFAACEQMKMEILRTRKETVENMIENNLIQISYNDLEDAIIPLLSELKTIVSKVSSGQIIDEVQLLGSSSKLPGVEEAIIEAIGEDVPVKTDIRKKEALAHGGSLILLNKMNITHLSPAVINSNIAIYKVSTVTNMMFSKETFDENACKTEFFLTKDTDKFKVFYDKSNLPLPLNKTYDEYIIENNIINSPGYRHLLVVFNYSNMEVSSVQAINTYTDKNIKLQFKLVNDDTEPCDKFINIINNEASKRATHNAKRETEKLAKKLQKDVANNKDFKRITTDLQRYNIKKTTEKFVSLLAEKANVWNEANYLTLYNEISTPVKNIYTKIEEDLSFPEAEKDFQEKFDLIQTKIEKELNKKYPYLKRSNINQTGYILHRAKELSNEIKRAKEQTSPYEFFPISTRDVKVFTKKLSEEIRRLSLIPVPKAKVSFLRSLLGFLNIYKDEEFIRNNDVTKNEFYNAK